MIFVYYLNFIFKKVFLIFVIFGIIVDSGFIGFEMRYFHFRAVFRKGKYKMDIKVIKDKWMEILEYMKTEFVIQDAVYKTWLLPMRPYALKDAV